MAVYTECPDPDRPVNHFDKLGPELMSTIFELSLPDLPDERGEVWLTQTAPYNLLPTYIFEWVLFNIQAHVYKTCDPDPAWCACNYDNDNYEDDEPSLVSSAETHAAHLEELPRILALPNSYASVFPLDLWRPNPNRQLRRPLELAQVCKRWRNVIRSISSIWANFEWKYNEDIVPLTNVIEQLEEGFRVRGACGEASRSLSLLIKRPSGQTPELYEYLASGWWKNLSIEYVLGWDMQPGTINSDWMEGLCAVATRSGERPSTYPGTHWQALESLKIITRTVTYTPGQLNLPLQHLAPGLRHLNILCKSIDDPLSKVFECTQVFNNLTTLEWVGDVTAPDSLQFYITLFSNSPQLQHLKLFQGSEGPDDMSCAANASRKWELPLQHNNLRKLEVHWRRWLAHFLQHSVSLPRLNTLNIIEVPFHREPQPADLLVSAIATPIADTLRALFKRSTSAAQALNEEFAITELCWRHTVFYPQDVYAVLLLVRETLDILFLETSNFSYAGIAETYFAAIDSAEAPKPFFPTLRAFGIKPMRPVCGAWATQVGNKSWRIFQRSPKEWFERVTRRYMGIGVMKRDVEIWKGQQLTAEREAEWAALDQQAAGFSADGEPLVVGLGLEFEDDVGEFEDAVSSFGSDESSAIGESDEGSGGSEDSGMQLLDVLTSLTSELEPLDALQHPGASPIELEALELLPQIQAAAPMGLESLELEESDGLTIQLFGAPFSADASTSHSGDDDAGEMYGDEPVMMQINYLHAPSISSLLSDTGQLELDGGSESTLMPSSTTPGPFQVLGTPLDADTDVPTESDGDARSIHNGSDGGNSSTDSDGWHVVVRDHGGLPLEEQEMEMAQGPSASSSWPGDGGSDSDETSEPFLDVQDTSYGSSDSGSSSGGHSESSTGSWSDLDSVSDDDDEIWEFVGLRNFPM